LQLPTDAAAAEAEPQPTPPAAAAAECRASSNAAAVKPGFLHKKQAIGCATAPHPAPAMLPCLSPSSCCSP
jgi:hypothetical protein